MSRTIEVIIDPVGRPVINANGFSGGSCLNATKPIEEALGGKVDRVEKTEMGMIETETQNEYNWI